MELAEWLDGAVKMRETVTNRLITAKNHEREKICFYISALTL